MGIFVAMIKWHDLWKNAMSLWGVILETWGCEGMGKGQTHKCTYRKAGVRWVLLTLWSGTTENLSLFIAYSLERELSPDRRCQQASSLRLESSRRRKPWLPVFVHIVNISIEPGKGFTTPPSLWAWPGRKALPVFHGLRHWSLTWSCPSQQYTLPRGFIQSLYIHWRLPLLPTEESLFCLTVPEGDSKIAGWQHRKLRNYISNCT